MPQLRERPPYHLVVRGDEAPEAFDEVIHRLIDDHGIDPGEFEGCPLPSEHACKADVDFDIHLVCKHVEKIQLSWRKKHQKELLKVPKNDLAPQETKAILKKKVQRLTPQSQGGPKRRKARRHDRQHREAPLQNQQLGIPQIPRDRSQSSGDNQSSRVAQVQTKSQPQTPLDQLSWRSRQLAS